jgi:hypothetical protein
MKTYLTSELTAPGVGAPFKQGTMIFLQQAFTELITLITQALVTNLSATGSSYSATVPYVIYGCQITITSSFNISAGLILWNGALYISNAAVGLIYPPLIGHTYMGTITTTYMTGANADPILLNDGVTTFNAHQIQSINWAYATTGVGTFNYNQLTYNQNISTLQGVGSYYDLATVKTLIDSLNTTVGTHTTQISTLNTKVSITGWTFPSLSAGWNNVATSQVCYLKDGMNNVRLGGVIGNNVVASPSTSLFNLPAGYRPSQVRRFAASIYNNNAGVAQFQPGYIQIDTSGNVVLIPQSGVSITATSWYIYLDNISFNTL